MKKPSSTSTSGSEAYDSGGGRVGCGCVVGERGGEEVSAKRQFKDKQRLFVQVNGRVCNAVPYRRHRHYHLLVLTYIARAGAYHALPTTYQHLSPPFLHPVLPLSNVHVAAGVRRSIRPMPVPFVESPLAVVVGPIGPLHYTVPLSLALVPRAGEPGPAGED